MRLFPLRVLQVIDAITRHLELGSFLAWPKEQRTSWLLTLHAHTYYTVPVCAAGD
jgi:hypothetical protein